MHRGGCIKRRRRSVNRDQSRRRQQKERDGADQAQAPREHPVCGDGGLETVGVGRGKQTTLSGRVYNLTTITRPYWIVWQEDGD